MLWESCIPAFTKLSSRCFITELGAVGCRTSAHVAADHVSVLEGEQLSRHWLHNLKTALQIFSTIASF